MQEKLSLKIGIVKRKHLFYNGNREEGDPLARIKLISAMLILGTIGWFAGHVPLPSNVIVTFRAGLAALTVGLYLLITRRKFRLQATKKELLLLLTSGVCIALNFVFLFEAYNHIPYYVASLCDYFAPVVVIDLSPLVFREKMVLRQFFCFAMATVGLLLLIGAFDSGENISPLGVGIGLTGMLFYVPVLMINKAIKNVGNFERTLLQFAVATVVLFLYLPFGEKPDFSQMTPTSWVFLCLIGVVHTGVAYCLMFDALPKLSGQEGALLTYIDPFTAVMVSVFVMQEPIGWMQIVGGILLVGFLLINELTGVKKK